MEAKHCLNCNEVVEKRYCPNCGQTTDTHRITFKHFLLHDILHGVWHVERGILFTIKEVFTRPGQAAVDYIGGKRIKYYNVFYLTVLVVGLNILLSEYYTQLESNYFTYTDIQDFTVGEKKYNNSLSLYSKILLLTLIPFFALLGYLIFKRKNYNLSEHFIISGVCFLGIMIITGIGHILSYLDFTENFGWISTMSNIAIPVAILFYISYCYYGAFNFHYGKSSLVGRIFLFLLLLLVGLYSVTGFMKIIFKAIYD